MKSSLKRSKLVYRIATFTDFEMILRIEEQLETIPSNFMVFGTFGMLIQGIIPNADALVFSSFFKVTVTEQIEHFFKCIIIQIPTKSWYFKDRRNPLFIQLFT